MLLGGFGALLANRLHYLQPQMPIDADAAKGILGEIISQLSGLLRSDSWEERYRAAESLLKIEDVTARELLKERAKEETHPLVRLLVEGEGFPD